MAALDGAVAHSGGPCGPKIVRDDLDLDVSHAGEQLLQKHGGITEGFEGLAAGRFEGVAQLTFAGNFANAVSATTCGGFDEQGISQASSMPKGLVHGLHRTATPGSNGNIGLLSQEFGSDLVAYAAHDVAVGTDKHDAHLAAEICESGLFCDKSPTYPHSLGPCCRKRPLQTPVVHVTAFALLRVGVEYSSSSQADPFIRLSDKHRVALAVGEQGNGPQRYALLLIELAGRMDEAHSSLAAVHNSDTLKFVVHRPSI